MACRGIVNRAKFTHRADAELGQITSGLSSCLRFLHSYEVRVFHLQHVPLLGLHTWATAPASAVARAVWRWCMLSSCTRPSRRCRPPLSMPMACWLGSIICKERAMAALSPATKASLSCTFNTFQRSAMLLAVCLQTNR